MSEHPDYDRTLKLLWCIAKQAGGQIEVYYAASMKDRANTAATTALQRQ